MAKVGDTVRFLNMVGGGKITKIKENIAYVEDEDGFEVPVLTRECVVVDSPKAPKTVYDKPEPVVPTKYVEPQKHIELPIEETETGNKMNVTLAYEPMNIKDLSNTRFATYLVNDSNYYLYFTYLSKDNDNWKLRYNGIVEPNIQILLEEFKHDTLPELSKIAIQLIAFKKDKEFALKNPISVEHRLDTTKFYKLHSFRSNEYFDNAVIALEIVKNDIPYNGFEIDPQQLKNAIIEQQHIDVPQRRPVIRNQKNTKEIIECDLHINSLLETTAGLSNSDMLNVQLDKFRETMNANIKKHGTKIVFIHGKGEGVLRKAVIDELKKKYPHCEAQDASFKEYGFGATLVKIK
ncbi:MAG: DUF2027 domain-containing protein [Muribaculaceae bacterium]|nr:DUF2027 domain-containing protein [Muribaculaceae bacterium]